MKALILLVVVAVVGCGPVDTGQPASAQAVSAPTTKPFALGAKATTARGNTLTVHGWVPAPSANPYLQAPAGTTHMAADVEGCAGNQQAMVNPIEFKAQMADNTRLAWSALNDKAPALPATVLTPGDCVRGFVAFAVPNGQKPITVNFETFDAEMRPVVIKWAIP